MFSDLPKRGCFQSNQRSFYRKCQSVPSHLPICCAQLLHAWKIGLNVRMRLEKFCERFNAKFIKFIFNRRPGLQQKRRLPLGWEFTKDLIFTVCNRHHLNYRKRSDWMIESIILFLTRFWLNQLNVKSLIFPNILKSASQAFSISMDHPPSDISIGLQKRKICQILSEKKRYPFLMAWQKVGPISSRNLLSMPFLTCRRPSTSIWSCNLSF